MKKFSLKPGWRYPHGTTFSPQGTNFCIFSKNASGVELLLYDSPEAKKPFQVVILDPEENRTFFFWHIYINRLPTGTCYTWRVNGPDDVVDSGFRFNPDKELVDPRAKIVTDSLWDRRKACKPGLSGGESLRAMIAGLDDYDWEGDTSIHLPPEKTIIYELHVGGFTRHKSSGVSHPGTYSAVIEKIPYLSELGVTAVELLPIMAFDEQDVPDNTWNLGHNNYWGYSTHSFFSPHPGYCVTPLAGTHIKEFRDMIKALHKAGIAVILDVVFNHTAEGGSTGPTINFKGLVNDSFYHLEEHDRSVYRDYSGCGNTVNCNHPLAAKFIVECLEYWVREMHVDAFRFDLASILARGMDGSPDPYAPVVWNIEFSDILSRSGLIAEAWDAGGLYQVGGFPGLRWAEWNGCYRDVIRRYIKGDKGFIGEVATRLCGSSDLYETSGRLPINSINFVTCHDGFTLWDLVSYNEKHNQANGEDNRDGCRHNLSWNCGVEGETSSFKVNRLRLRQVKNFMAVLFLSHGVPMILSGDEVLRSQQGNNNCYCQDNELSWFDWTLVKKNQGMFRFVREMIAFRKRHLCLTPRRFVTGIKDKGRRMPDITWHGRKLNKPPWNDPADNLLAFTLGGIGRRAADLHVILNMSGETARVRLPSVRGRKWHKTIDTAGQSPRDIILPDNQRPVRKKFCPAKPHSVIVFEGR